MGVTVALCTLGTVMMYDDGSWNTMQQVDSNVYKIQGKQDCLRYKGNRTAVVCILCGFSLLTMTAEWS